MFASEQVQRLGQLLIDLVGRHGDPADPATAELAGWLDVQAKRNLVLTFGGGVQRGAARADRDGRTRAAAGAALTWHRLTWNART